MDFFQYGIPDRLGAFVTSLAIGLLIGLERERKPDAKAGLRTFSLVALLGTLSALITEKTGNSWILALGLATVGTMMIVSLATDPHEDGDPGTTSVIALMVCYALGATIWFGYENLAVMLAIATTALLYFKAELHGFSQRLTSKDLISVLQFAVLSFIILPILPDRDFGPYSAFNPHQIWWMVVLISGVSLAGYAALRITGERHGAIVIGLFGGLVSSTATTMVFARKAMADKDMVPTAAAVVVIANMVVLLRLSLVSAIVAPAIIPSLVLVLGAGLLAGLGVTAWSWRAIRAQGPLPMPDVANPTEIRTAFSFGFLYAVVLFLAAWLQDIAGDKGVYAASLISGLTDVDAITLTTLRLFNMQKLSEAQSVLAISLAVLSNLTFKSGLVLILGGRGLAKYALPGLGAIAAGLIAALMLAL
jgi:uncharacterized membrane protein (DUF4010 family)